MDDHEKPKELIATDGHRFWFFWGGNLGEKKLIECVDTQYRGCTMWTSLREETDRADPGDLKKQEQQMSIASERKYSAQLIKIMGLDNYEKAHARAAAEPKAERDARWAEYQRNADRGELI